MIIKSRGKRNFKIVFVLTLAITSFSLWLFDNNSLYLALTCVFGFVSLLEYSFHCQTTLELTDTYLKVTRKGLMNTIDEEYMIELKDIQSSFYKNKKYDNWELYQRLLWELSFPSGQSNLIIYKLDGIKIEIPFVEKGNELLKLHNKLPDRMGAKVSKANCHQWL